MANLPETTFMPQQPLLRVEGGSRRSEPINLALVVANIIFFVTLSVAGGMYFYKAKLDKEVLAKGQQLADQEKKFNIDEITVYKNLQTSLTAAKKLVDSHTIFSVILDTIESHAAENVGLTSFDYKKEDAGIKLSVSGQAPSYAAVYFQIEEWRKTPHVKKVNVVSLALDEHTSVVAFSATIDIDPSYLDYAQVLQEQSQKQVQAQYETVITPPTTNLPKPPIITSGNPQALPLPPIMPPKLK